MYEDLKKQVKKANQELAESGLVKFTFGNLSLIDNSKRFVVIKPSGIHYKSLEDEDMVVIDIDGKIIEGEKMPSSDTQTHLEIYRNFQTGSVIHTHSEYATAFAQAKKAIDCLGTTHADYFFGSIPVTRDLTEQEIQQDYELNTGRVIVETFKEKELDPIKIPACLVASHGPFVWGESIEKAMENALALEEIAKINFLALLINPEIKSISESLLNKHYLRKHGKDAYYGQK